MIPIHPVPKPPQPDEKPCVPEDALCYLVGSGGLYKQVRNEFYEARVRVDGIPHLAELGETAEVRAARLPLQLLRLAEAFFAEAHREHRSEAVVLLLYGPAARQWRIEVPPQAVQGLHVSYDISRLPDPPEGFRRFGSIHSHASVKAFHSGTDDRDEAPFDGLHITVGNVDQPVRSYSARWMLAGKAFKAELADVVEAEALPKADPAWLAMVRGDEGPEYGFEWPSQGPTLGSPAFREPRRPDPLSCAPEDFESLDEYEQYLEWTIEELEQQLIDTRAAREAKGEAEPCFDSLSGS